MTREEMISKLWDMISTKDIPTIKKADSICGDWNSEHDDQEIFMTFDYDNGIIGLEDDSVYIYE